MKTDEQIRQDVINQIKWNAQLSMHASEIGVAVKNGVVTLSGQVDTYLKKLEAEKEAKKIAGVKAIAEEIHVGISPASERTDEEIAEAALNALKWNTSIPEATHILVKVEDGAVTLEGEVEWEFQRTSARNAVAMLSGVRTVNTFLKIKEKVTPEDLKQKIKAAFLRSATIEAKKIEVEVLDSKVILKGHVRTFTEKEDAENAVWSAPGILTVDNRLELKDEPESVHEVKNNSDSILPD